MRTKIVQGFDQPYNQFLSYELMDIMRIFKFRYQLVDSKKFTILNVIFREINNKIMIILHIKNKYQENIVDYIKEIFGDLNIMIDSLFVSFGPFYNRNNKRITIFGEYYYLYKFSNGTQIRYLGDSFLQQNLFIAEQLYQYIEDNINIIKIINNSIKLIGIGDDCLNIAAYLQQNIYSFMHCEETMNCMNYKFNGGATLILDDWFENLQNNKNIEFILITTPGRKGLSKEELATIQKLNINYIFYIGCCIKSSEKNIEYFIQNKYKIVEKKEFPKMFNKVPGYLETCYILEKEKKIIETKITIPIDTNKLNDNSFNFKCISIGSDCSIAYHLKQEFYPFDWCKSYSIELIQYLLQTGFESLYNINNYKVLQKSNVHFHILSDELPSEIIPNSTLIVRFELDIFKNMYIDFPHDFKQFSIDEFNEFVERMKRRIVRFNEIPKEKRIFIRYETKKITKNIFEIYTKILEYCNKIIIYTNRNPELEFTDSDSKLELINSNSKTNIEIIKDKYTDEHQSWKREGLCNYYKNQ